METTIGLALLAFALAAIFAGLWRLAPENRENKGEYWVRGNEYRVRGTTSPVSLAIPSDWIQDLDRLGLLPVDEGNS